MKKITTLFKKDPTNLGRVINEVDPENEWALYPPTIVTRKFDGTACAIIGGELYKRYDAKHGKPAPVGGIPCQDPDPITGHWPHWVKCDRENPADKWAFEGFRELYEEEVFIYGKKGVEDGTYELCGPKVKGNPEGLQCHKLLRHGKAENSFALSAIYTFDDWKEILSKDELDMEGVVFHHPDGRMCKLRKSDFGVKRKKLEVRVASPVTRIDVTQIGDTYRKEVEVNANGLVYGNMLDSNTIDQINAS